VPNTTLFVTRCAQRAKLRLYGPKIHKRGRRRSSQGIGPAPQKTSSPKRVAGLAGRLVQAADGVDSYMSGT
jgi:hypothetical protein